jgi:hypothetical protein
VLAGHRIPPAAPGKIRAGARLVFDSTRDGISESATIRAPPRASCGALRVLARRGDALGLIALQEHPFKGALRVSSAPLQKAITLIVPP